jgi:diadenosine tetraphosphatase ApaH/serine/threonine PP2A family protein phosphatase
VKIAVISDIHGNLEGLQAVLDDIAGQDVCTVYCLGDITGYGVDVNPCCDLVREHCAITLLGNHDDAVLGRTPIACFNDFAARSIEFARNTLAEDNREFLAGLPYEHVEDGLHLAHSTPYQPQAWHYLHQSSLRTNMAIIGDRIGLVGHSHLQGVYLFPGKESGEKCIYRPGLSMLDREVPIGPEGALVVAGSVGQPRDKDARASYVIVDASARTLRFRRCRYPIEQAQKKILQAGLPDFLAVRLALGY